MAETNTNIPPVPSPNTPPPKEAMKKVTLGKKKRKISPAIYIVILVAAGFAFWYFLLRTPPAPPIVIRYAALDTGNISRSVTATGQLQATTTVQVGSQVSGLVKKIYVDFNAKVKAGQLLAMLDTAPYVASLTQAIATVTKARSDLLLAVANEARERELLAQHLVAQSDYDASINALKDARATLDVDSAQYEQAKVNLGYCYIRSPVAGVVQARDVDSGQTVAAGLNVTVLYVIARDLTQMQVAADVDEADIGQVTDSQDVIFSVDAYPGEKFKGKVWQVQINPTVTTNVVTYVVIIRTDNPDQRLLPGMTATANIINATRTNVMRVPVSATRFVPPPELVPPEAASAAKDTAGRAARRQHKKNGDSTQYGGVSYPKNNEQSNSGSSTYFSFNGGGNHLDTDHPHVATVYVKSNSDKGPKILPVKLVTGLSDANYTEVLSSNPPLHAGDSIVVAAFVLSPVSGGSSSSPLNSRPGQGGGGRGGGRF
jgi:HlyD family secretion protein